MRQTKLQRGKQIAGLSDAEQISIIVDNPEFDRVLLAVLNYPGPDDSVELDDIGEHDANREG